MCTNIYALAFHAFLIIFGWHMSSKRSDDDVCRSREHCSNVVWFHSKVSMHDFNVYKKFNSVLRWENYAFRIRWTNLPHQCKVRIVEEHHKPKIQCWFKCYLPTCTIMCVAISCNNLSTKVEFSGYSSFCLICRWNLSKFVEFSLQQNNVQMKTIVYTRPLQNGARNEHEKHRQRQEKENKSEREMRELDDKSAFSY